METPIPVCLQIIEKVPVHQNCLPFPLHIRLLRENRYLHLQISRIDLMSLYTQYQDLLSFEHRRLLNHSLEVHRLAQML